MEHQEKMKQPSDNSSTKETSQYLDVPVFVSRGTRPYVDSCSSGNSFISTLTVRGKVFIVVLLIAIVSCALLFWL